MIVLGIGSGASLPLALAFISLRAADHHQAASLSMMAQSIGYLLAAFGPIAFGLLHDLAGNWSLALGVLTAMGRLQALIGLRADRDETLFQGSFGLQAFHAFEAAGKAQPCRRIIWRSHRVAKRARCAVFSTAPLPPVWKRASPWQRLREGRNGGSPGLVTDADDGQEARSD